MTRLFIYEAICAGALGDAPPESLEREGRAMLSALVEDFQALPGVEVVTLLRQCASHAPREEGASRGARGVHWGEAAAFARLVGECDMALAVAPELGGLLLERCETIQRLGKPSLGCSTGAIRLTADKLLLAAHLRGHAVPTPATDLLADSALPPLTREARSIVIKPRFGAGSLATRRLDSADQVLAILPEMHAEAPGEEFIVQPWMPGLPVSVAFLCGAERALPLLPAEQILSDDGRCRYLGGRLPLAEPWRDRALTLAERAITAVPGLRGYVGVDLVLGSAAEGRDDLVIEINPRLTTSYLGLRRLAQANLAALWMQVLEGASELAGSIEWKPGTTCFAADGPVLV